MGRLLPMLLVAGLSAVLVWDAPLQGQNKGKGKGVGTIVSEAARSGLRGQDLAQFVRDVQAYQGIGPSAAGAKQAQGKKQMK